MEKSKALNAMKAIGRQGYTKEQAKDLKERCIEANLKSLTIFFEQIKNEENNDAE